VPKTPPTPLANYNLGKTPKQTAKRIDLSGLTPERRQMPQRGEMEEIPKTPPHPV